jgi:hypothetical protein
VTLKNFLTLLAFTLGLSARADTLVSTLGPGDSFSTTSARFVAGTSTFTGYQGAGVTFSLPDDRVLTSIEIVGRYTSGTNSFVVNLAPDSAGQPGAPLETWTTSFASGTGTIVALPSLSGALLSAGGTYWLTVTPSAANTRGAWSANDQSINSGNMKTQGVSSSSPWGAVNTNDVAYRVSGFTAPEPATLGLLALGAVSAGTILRRRRPMR